MTIVPQTALPRKTHTSLEPLLPQHAEMLEQSGIAPTVCAQRGYRSITTPSEAVALGFADYQARLPALLVPVHGVGSGVVLYQLRPDNPRINKEGKAVKYETPAGGRMCLDVPPAVLPVLNDPSVPLIFTEGIKKGDAVVSAGGNCIALLGVWNWRGTNDNGAKGPLADFDAVNLDGRSLSICYDSDVMEKREVRAALDGLTAFLQGRGASVLHIFLPEAPDGGKQGVDDYLAAGHTIDDVYALAQAVPAVRPMIDAGNHNLPDVTRQAWAALTATNDPPYLFQHGGAPSRLEYDPDGHVVLMPLTEHRLRCEVAQAAAWHVMRGKEQRMEAAEPPLSVIQNMLAQAALPLPVLRRITETPVFAPDGRLIEAAGFDAASGIYYCPPSGLTVPPVPDKPTAADIAGACTVIIDDLLGDFPFSTAADRAAAVALFLLAYVRAMIPGLTPMHGIESPTVGSGKGLLGDVLVRPAFGQHGGMIAEAASDDEWRKRIGAKLREGAPIIHLDNLTRPLDSGALAMALTAGVFSDRVLGQTATFRVPVRNIWVFTANNPVLSLEIARRTVRIRIAANEEKPWQRDTFRHKNLRAWADRQRGTLIHAALTLVRGWIVAGKPMADVTLGSYEEWAATMGGILDVAGVPGFLDNLAAFYEGADLEGAAWRQFVALWAEKYQSNKIGVADLFTLAATVDGLDFGKGGDRSQRTSFGAQLTKQRDRIYDGYRITLAGESNRVKRWRLIPVQPNVPPAQRYIPVSLDIATETDGGMYLNVPLPRTPRTEKMDIISLQNRGQKVHTGTYPHPFTLTEQGKTGMYLGAGDTSDAPETGDIPHAHGNPPEPTRDTEDAAWEDAVSVDAQRADSADDEDVLWQWAVAAQADAVDAVPVEGVPEQVRMAALRRGYTFDSSVPIEREAARLEVFLTAHDAAKQEAADDEVRTLLQ